MLALSIHLHSHLFGFAVRFYLANGPVVSQGWALNRRAVYIALLHFQAPSQNQVARTVNLNKMRKHNEHDYPVGHYVEYRHRQVSQAY